jgi:hypothetical protein
METMVLTPNPESANYALSILYDMLLAGRMALQSRFAGIETGNRMGQAHFRHGGRTKWRTHFKNDAWKRSRTSFD